MTGLLRGFRETGRFIERVSRGEKEPHLLRNETYQERQILYFDSDKIHFCGLTQILTRNGKDWGGGNGMDSAFPSTIPEQIVSNQAGKGQKAFPFPPGRIFTRRRSLVRVQQSPPKIPEIPRNFRYFYLFLQLFRVFAAPRFLAVFD